MYENNPSRAIIRIFRELEVLSEGLAFELDKKYTDTGTIFQQ
jgi:hypothetical protein